MKSGLFKWLATLAVLIVAGTPAIGQPTDIAVKAAFLPRFARYVTWPSAAMPRGSDPFGLCVIGGDPFGGVLDDAARSQSVDGRAIAIRRMDSAAAVNNCQIAFVGNGRPSQLIAALGRRPVLTVTDAANGSERGIIHFVVIGGRVRFYIDQALASKRGLSISSRLLALAVGVRQ